MTAQPTDLPGFGRFDKTIPVPLGDVVLTDRDGDDWFDSGARTASGERVLVCPAPREADDRGDGPSFPWTEALVADWFGPVTSVARKQAA